MTEIQPIQDEQLDVLLEPDVIAEARAQEIVINARSLALTDAIQAVAHGFSVCLATLGASAMPFYLLWLISHGTSIEREWAWMALGGWTSLTTFLWVRNGGKRK